MDQLGMRGTRMFSTIISTVPSERFPVYQIKGHRYTLTQEDQDDCYHTRLDSIRRSSDTRSNCRGGGAIKSCAVASTDYASVPGAKHGNTKQYVYYEHMSNSIFRWAARACLRTIDA
jgi:hypothetical protein